MPLPWIGSYLLLFSAGTLLATTWVPLELVGRRFYRVNGYIALFLGSAGALASSLASAGPLRAYWPLAGWLAGLFSVAALQASARFRWHVPVGLALAAGGMALPLAGRSGVSDAVECALSGSVLGAALVAMLLGHTYLAGTNLSFDLLVDACRGLVALVAVRGAAAAALFWPHRSLIGEWKERDMVLILFVLVRFGAGIACAAVLSSMALACARIRSNQSATGILYVVVGFVSIGELIAAYFSVTQGVGL